MKHSTIKLAVAAVLVTLLLAGCGAKSEGTSAGNNEQAALSSDGNGNMQQPPDRSADVMGKVVKATNDSIVLQESKTPPSEMRGGGGFGGGGGRQGNGGQSNQRQPNREREGGADQSPSGNAASANQSGGGSRGAGGSGGVGRSGGMKMEFKDEQTTLTIKADTPIVTMSYGQNGMSMNEVKAGDLKEGEIVTVWLDETDKTQVQYVMLRNMPSNGRREGDK